MSETGDAAASEPTVRERVLAAGLATAQDHGLGRLSMGDVAKRAGVSRQTVYKYFPSKEALVAAVVEHEAAELIAAVVAAAAEEQDPTEALETALATALVAVREHQLLDRLLTTEPEVLLPMLIGGSSPVLRQVREVAELVIGAHVPGVEPAVLHRAADVIARLLVSYAVNPPDEPPEELAASVAHLLKSGTEGFTGSAAPAAELDPSR